MPPLPLTIGCRHLSGLDRHQRNAGEAAGDQAPPGVIDDLAPIRHDAVAGPSALIVPKFVYETVHAPIKMP